MCVETRWTKMPPKRVQHQSSGPGRAGLNEHHQGDAADDPNKMRIWQAIRRAINDIAVGKRHGNNGELEQHASAKAWKAQRSAIGGHQTKRGENCARGALRRVENCRWA